MGGGEQKTTAKKHKWYFDFFFFFLKDQIGFSEAIWWQGQRSERCTKNKNLGCLWEAQSEACNRFFPKPSGGNQSSWHLDLGHQIHGTRRILSVIYKRNNALFWNLDNWGITSLTKTWVFVQSCLGGQSSHLDGRRCFHHGQDQTSHQCPEGERTHPVCYASNSWPFQG